MSRSTAGCRSRGNRGWRSTWQGGSSCSTSPGKPCACCATTSRRRVSGAPPAARRAQPALWPSLWSPTPNGRQGAGGRGVRPRSPLRLAHGVVRPCRHTAGRVGRPQRDPVEEARVRRRHVAPVVAERLERRLVRHVPPLPQRRVVGQDAVIARRRSAASACSATGIARPAGSPRSPPPGRCTACSRWPRAPRRPRAVRRNPAPHHLAVTLAPDHGIGLPQIAVAHEPDDDDALAVLGYPADADLDLDARLVVALEHQEIAGHFLGRGGGSAANDRGASGGRRWRRCPATAACATTTATAMHPATTAATTAGRPLLRHSLPGSMSSALILPSPVKSTCSTGYCDVVPKSQGSSAPVVGSPVTQVIVHVQVPVGVVYVLR